MGLFIFDIEKELSKYNLTKDTYEKLLEDCYLKSSHQSDDDWSEIALKHNLPWNSDSLRKASTSILGGSFVKQYYEEKYLNSSPTMDDDYEKRIQKKIDELRKERIKVQTLNIERDRIDRQLYRQELFYEQIGGACNSLPLPEFLPLYNEEDSNEISWLMAISDLHFGARFTSMNNSYSPEECKERLELLVGNLFNFVNERKIRKLRIACLGDVLQGILRISDLKLNDSSVVRATVEISRLLAQFLTSVSEFVQIDYYHVPTANHSQLRPLGTKANQISDEDLEYVIGNYIKDLCKGNPRINVILPEDNSQYISIDIPGFAVYAAHGHQIKNAETSLKDLSMLKNEPIDYLILGHYHAGREIPVSENVTSDCEVLVCPSFVGSDPYSDTIMKGSKASVVVYGFDRLYGYTDKKKFILN